ncbi:uncharacterized protein EHS24_009158 [Apiotrichum porosum]|uniref:Uncharacterized protein n=1 Tax=Apiotrichum porosum TaxID=105984 RepID=A0A427XNU6_9TREE|nr:uncharacterized protein EHS24_009158 [Apiotrichum porosum]RSH80576.1 hypothetical protein EHS24_009158 [Apiotrichum porosum]
MPARMFSRLHFIPFELEAVSTTASRDGGTSSVVTPRPHTPNRGRWASSYSGNSLIRFPGANMDPDFHCTSKQEIDWRTSFDQGTMLSTKPLPMPILVTPVPG